MALFKDGAEEVAGSWIIKKNSNVFQKLSISLFGKTEHSL
jgi:hypothetical protein